MQKRLAAGAFLRENASRMAVSSTNRSGGVFEAGAPEPWALECLADVKSERQRFVWPGVLPVGLTVLAGHAGVSKSLMATSLAARLTSGAGWPDGRSVRVPGRVAYFAAEDGRATIKARMRAAGGDERRTVVLAGGEISSLQEQGCSLLARLDTYEDLHMLVFDPVNSFLAGVNTSHDATVRRVMQPLVSYAERRSIAVILIIHLNKTAGQMALHRVLGSPALAALARAAWLVGYDPRGGEHNRIMAPLKYNLGRPPLSIAYRIAEIGQGRGRPRQPVLRFDAFDLPIPADDLVSQGTSKNEPRRSARAVALAAIAEILEGREMISSAELKLLLAQRGASWRTFARVMSEAGLEAVKVGAHWYYARVLPQHPAPMQSVKLKSAIAAGELGGVVLPPGSYPVPAPPFEVTQ